MLVLSFVVSMRRTSARRPGLLRDNLMPFTACWKPGPAMSSAARMRTLALVRVAAKSACLACHGIYDLPRHQDPSGGDRRPNSTRPNCAAADPRTFTRIVSVRLLSPRPDQTHFLAERSADGPGRAVRIPT